MLGGHRGAILIPSLNEWLLSAVERILILSELYYIISLGFCYNISGFDSKQRVCAATVYSDTVGYFTV